MPQQICPKCSNEFNCNTTECWCFDFPPLLEPNSAANCYCQKCLKSEIQLKIEQLLKSDNQELNKVLNRIGPVSNPMKDIDYQINSNGQWVFTKWYHLRRGTCCGSACVNCPFDHINVPNKR